MSALLKDKFYGLTIGCAIGDCMGSVADLMLQDGAEPNVSGPADGEGVWNEAATLMLCQSKALDSEEELKPSLERALTAGEGTCTGDLTNISSKTLSVASAELSSISTSTAASTLTLTSTVCQHETDCLPLMGAVAMHFYRDFEGGLRVAYNNQLASGCQVCMDACKFYYAVLDLALHGCTKKQILNPASYANLTLCPEINSILPLDPDKEIFDLDGCDEVISCLSMVLYTFRSCDNTEKSLQTVVNNSLSPVRTGALMGQLCGAYYGLTDIKEEWLEVLKSKSTLTGVTKAKIDILSKVNGTVKAKAKVPTSKSVQSRRGADEDSGKISTPNDDGSNTGVSS